MEVVAYGRAALLVEADDGPSALGLYRAVLDSGLPVVEAVPAARTVLLRFADEAVCAANRAAVGRLVPLSVEDVDAAEVEIPVVYDGEDIADVARMSGLTPREVVELHAGGTYEVGFVGFAPGFGYLTGLDARLHVPRLDSPRTSVPAGSVAIAGPYAAVYPSASPGGWRLLGRTSTAVFDVDRDPPALLRPGFRVRFVEVTG